MTQGKLRIVVLVLVAGLCLAAERYRYPENRPPASKPSKPPANQPAVSTPPAATQPQPLTDDQAAEAAARKAYDAAKKTLDDLTAKLQAEFHTGADWTAAQAKLARVKADLLVAGEKSVAGNSDYQDALATERKAAEDLDAAKKADSARDTIANLAQTLVEARDKVAKIAKDIGENDPAVQSALSKVAAAQKALDALDRQFQQSLPGNADYTAAKSAVDAAGKAAADAHAKVVADGG